MLRALAEAEARQVRFLVPGLIPLRTLTLVAGVGGLGKSTWLAGIAARISRGDFNEPGNVIIVSYEDTTEEMLRPRVEAAGGDLKRVFDIIVPEHQGPVVLPSDLSELRECVRSVQAQLVIVDPVVAAIDVSYDAHKDQHVRAVLAELAALTEQENLGLAMVGHLNKAPSREAYIRVANSVAFWNASRSVVLVTEDPEQPDDVRLVAQRKANFARLAPIERHRIEPITLEGTVDPDTGKAIETSRMVFVEYADDVDGNDLLGPREREGKTSRAEDLLAFLLADGEWHESGELKKIAAAAGFNERTVQRGCQELELEIDRRGYPSATWWRLPQSRQEVPTEFGATVDSAQPSRLRAAPTPVAPVAPTATEGEDGCPVEDTSEADYWAERIRSLHDEGEL